MKILFSEQAWEDYQYWLATDKKLLKRINQLIRDTCRDPFQGIGKPEPLRHLLKGYWSRLDQLLSRLFPDGVTVAIEIANPIADQFRRRIFRFAC